MSDESSMAKILITLFIVEVVGILLAVLVGAGSNNPFLAQFANFSSNLNKGIVALTTSFANCGALNCLTPLPVDNTPIASQLAWLVNIGIYVLNIIFKVFNLIFNVFDLVILVLGLLVYLFVVLIPSLLIATGILGYLLGIGYVFVVIFLAYYLFKIVVGIIGLMAGIIGRFV